MEHGIRACTISKLNDDMILAMQAGAEKTVEAIQRELVRRIHNAKYDKDNQGAIIGGGGQHHAHAA